MRPLVVKVTTKARAADPRAVALASGLGRLLGRGINGRTGTVRYGYPAEGTRARYSGYAFPPQLFRGYTAKRVAGGSIQTPGSSLPGTASPAPPASPLSRAMATVTASQMAGR